MRTLPNLLVLSMVAALAACGVPKETSSSSSPVSSASVSSSSSVTVSSSSVVSSSSTAANMGNAAMGKVEFDSQCTLCHTPQGGGKFGTGGNAFDMNALKKTTLVNLASYIDQKMPLTGPGNCVGDCALDIAAYLKESMNNSGSNITNFGTHYIEVMASCDASDATGGSSKLTVVSQNAFMGSSFWTHVPNNATEFGNLKTAAYTDARFKLNSIQPTADASCSGAKTHTGTWVKKFVDWDHQHANGLTVDNIYKNVSTFDEIVIELKVNSAKTNLPTMAMLKSAFGSFATDSEIDGLDDQNVAFGIGISNASNGSGFTGQTFVEINMAQYADKWIRIIIPFAEMPFKEEVNWSKTRDMNYQEAQNLSMRQFFIVPETYSATQQAGVLRGTFDGSWNWNANNNNPWPNDLFKEQNVSIRLIEVHYK